MLLAIDAGNTNIVFALYEGEKMRAQWRAVTQVSRTADEYAVWLHQLLELEGFANDAVEAVVIGTVVPRALHNLQNAKADFNRTDALLHLTHVFLRLCAGATDLAKRPTLRHKEMASLKATRLTP